MFNKFIADKQKALRGGDKERRPYLATECRDLNAADKWRQEILREIGKKVMEIQNAGLGEHRLRDLNDEINKLIREKGHWERQILKLGGPNYAAQGGAGPGGDEGADDLLEALLAEPPAARPEVPDAGDHEDVRGTGHVRVRRDDRVRAGDVEPALRRADVPRVVVEDGGTWPSRHCSTPFVDGTPSPVTATARRSATASALNTDS